MYEYYIYTTYILMHLDFFLYYDLWPILTEPDHASLHRYCVVAHTWEPY